MIYKYYFVYYIMDLMSNFFYTVPNNMRKQFLENAQRVFKRFLFLYDISESTEQPYENKTIFKVELSDRPSSKTEINQVQIALSHY